MQPITRGGPKWDPELGSHSGVKDPRLSKKKFGVSLVQEGEVGKSGFFYHSRRLPWVGKMASVGVDGGSSRSWQG